MALSSEAARIAQQSPWLQPLLPAARAEIIAAACVRDIPAGALLFTAGASADGLHLLLTGEVRTWSANEQGHPVVFKVLGAGELVGCIAAFSGQPQPASAQATTSVQSLFWPAARLRLILRENPDAAMIALHLLGERTVSLMRRLVMVSTASASARIAAALLDLAGGKPRRIKVSRQELADLTATTMHTVSRTVSAWHRRGWVIGGRSRIELVDVPALTHEAPPFSTGPAVGLQ